MTERDPAGKEHGKSGCSWRVGRKTGEVEIVSLEKRSAVWGGGAGAGVGKKEEAEQSVMSTTATRDGVFIYLSIGRRRSGCVHGETGQRCRAGPANGGADRGSRVDLERTAHRQGGPVVM